jgi:hypothetical protein
MRRLRDIVVTRLQNAPTIKARLMLHAALLLESTQYICLLFCANAMLDSMNDSM